MHFCFDIISTSISTRKVKRTPLRIELVILAVCSISVKLQCVLIISVLPQFSCSRVRQTHLIDFSIKGIALLFRLFQVLLKLLLLFMHVLFVFKRLLMQHLVLLLLHKQPLSKASVVVNLVENIVLSICCSD